MPSNSFLIMLSCDQDSSLVQRERGGKMLHMLSDAEEMQGRRRKFSLLQSGLLFDLGMRMWYIAVAPVGKTKWKVVALNDKNRSRIIAGTPPTLTTLRFQEMRCLNVHPV